MSLGFTEDQVQRYSRHIILPNIGGAGQRKLLDSKVLVIGAGVLPGVIGAIQATEAIKIITGEGEPLIGRLLLYDALHMDFQEVKIRWDADCPVCGKDPSITELIDYELFCGVPAAQ